MVRSTLGRTVRERTVRETDPSDGGHMATTAALDTDATAPSHGPADLLARIEARVTDQGPQTLYELCQFLQQGHGVRMDLSDLMTLVQSSTVVAVTQESSASSGTAGLEDAMCRLLPSTQAGSTVVTGPDGTKHDLFTYWQHARKGDSSLQSGARKTRSNTVNKTANGPTPPKSKGKRRLTILTASPKRRSTAAGSRTSARATKTPTPATGTKKASRAGTSGKTTHGASGKTPSSSRTVRRRPSSGLRRGF